METYLEKIKRLNEAYCYKDMEVDGVVYHYLIAGEPNRDVITLLNGGMNSHQMWVDFIEHLSEKYRVVSFDYPKELKTYAQIIGIDFWGSEWNYAKEQCEKNAKLEGVAERVSFQKGDAAKLDFEDEIFDGVVSNFVFHEVRSAKDKRDVVREALRVIKPGGAFAFQDMFGQKQVYGDMEEFINTLREEHLVSEIHYIENIEKKIPIPGFVTAPWMIKDAGLIYGIKGHN